MKRRFISLVCAISMAISIVPVLQVDAGVTSATIEIGDYVRMGVYRNEPILWRCVDIDEHGPLMLSDKILCAKAFDARTSTNNGTGSHSRNYDINTHRSRDNGGSNYWADSNIRSWLNSEADAGEVVWECGNAPSSDYVDLNATGLTTYDNEAGFLNGFTQVEKSAVKTVTHKSILAKADSGLATSGSELLSVTRSDNVLGNIYPFDVIIHNFEDAYAEEVTDRVFLLDFMQVLDLVDKQDVLGEDYYHGKLADVAIGEISFSSFEAGKNWLYWTRTPVNNYSNCCVFYVNSSKAEMVDTGATYGFAGIRPAFYLSDVDFALGQGTENEPYIIDSSLKTPEPAESPATTIAPKVTPDIIPEATITPEPTATIKPTMEPKRETNIEVGEYVEMGSYMGDPILWRCVDIDEKGPLMLSDNVLCVKAFDATTSDTPQGGSHARDDNASEYFKRLDNGSNYWKDSTIRTWLNSSAEAGQIVWPCGNPPYDENVDDCGIGLKGYADEAGFLSGFSSDELNAVQEVTQKSILSKLEVDAGMATSGAEGFTIPQDENYKNSNTYPIYLAGQNYDIAYGEDVTDRMFLLDMKQINEIDKNASVLGEDAFIGRLTEKAVGNTSFPYFTAGSQWQIWTRTPVYNFGSNVFYLGNPFNGRKTYGISTGADYSFAGIQPAFYLNEEVVFGSGKGTQGVPYKLGNSDVVITPTPQATVEPTALPIEKNIEIGDYVRIGSYRGEPILWRCIDVDEHGPLMLSDKILCAKAFDARTSANEETGSHTRGHDENKYRNRGDGGSNYWADSNIRSWLNSEADAGKVVWECGNAPSASYVDLNATGLTTYDNEAGFLNNFTETEKSAIKTVTHSTVLARADVEFAASGEELFSVTRSDNVLGNTYPFDVLVHNFDDAYTEDVTDRMFLLDFKQVLNMADKQDILGEDYYHGRLSDVAIGDIRFSTYKEGETWNYWTRTPVNNSGNSDIFYVYSVKPQMVTTSADYGFAGIRPAFYLSDVDFVSGQGTENEPYTVDELTATPAPKATPAPTPEPLPTFVPTPIPTLSPDTTPIPVDKRFTMLRDNFQILNTWSSFGYGSNYYIPAERFISVFGTTEGVYQYYSYGPWGGSCYGLSATASLFFEEKLDYTKYSSSAKSLYEIPAPGTPKSDLIVLLEHYQIAQLMEPVLDERYRNWNEMDDIIRAVQNFEATGENPIVLCVFGIYGGHALVPYKCIMNSDGSYSIYVYDCNYPASKSRILTINRSMTAFSYDGYDYSISFNYADTVNSALDGKISMFGDDNADRMTLTVNSDNVKITDANGVPLEDIDGAYEVIPVVLEFDLTKKTFVLPGGEYIIENNNTDTEMLEISVANDEDYYEIRTDNMERKVIVGSDNSTGHIYAYIDSEGVCNNSIRTMNNSGMSMFIESVATNFGVWASDDSAVEIVADSSVKINGESVDIGSSGKVGNIIIPFDTVNDGSDENVDFEIRANNSLIRENNTIRGNLSYSIYNNTDTLTEAKIIVGLYSNDGKLISVIKSDTELLTLGNNYIDLGEINYSDVAEVGYHIKCFAWDTNMKPLAKISKTDI